MRPEPHSYVCGCVFTTVSYLFIYSFSEPQLMLLPCEAVNAFLCECTNSGHKLGKKIRPSMSPSKDVENFDYSLGKKEQE